VFVVPIEELEAFTAMITGVMETTINGIHFPVEVEVCGQSWAGHYS
jgi:DNA polymerase I-like protein with 3'-5' exonuclease and polymerase domains